MEIKVDHESSIPSISSIHVDKAARNRDFCLYAKGLNVREVGNRTERNRDVGLDRGQTLAINRRVRIVSPKSLAGDISRYLALSRSNSLPRGQKSAVVQVRE